MSAHTPGPWRANFHHTRRDGGRTYAMVDDGKSIVPLAAVTLGVEGCSEDEGRANAGLIAAAPELLAGCVAMLGYMEKGFLVRNTAGDNEDDWALKALAFVKDIQAMHAAVAKATGTAP